MNLVSEATCPVCFDGIRSPVSLCTNGHGVCAECKANLPTDSCPLCTQPFSPHPNVLLDNILDLLPQRCKFGACQMFVKPSADDHEKWCGFLTTTCQLNHCDWTGYGKRICDHIKVQHPTSYMTEDKLAKEMTFVISNICNDSYVPLIYKEHFFWMHRRNQDGKLFVITFEHVPNGMVFNNSFDIKLVIGDINKNCSSYIKVTPDNVLQNGENSMYFGIPILQSLLDKDGFLKYKLTVTSSSEPVKSWFSW